MTVPNQKLSPSFSFALAVAAMAVFTPLPARTVPFAFVDEGAANPAFAAFRKRFITAVHARDIEALKRLSHPKVRLSLDGARGRRALARALSRAPVLWRTLARILKNGGRFTMEDDGWGQEQRMFIAPYTFFAEIPGRNAAAVIVLKDENVPVRTAPANHAPVLSHLTDEALEVVFGERADNRRWFEVRLDDGRRGFVKNGPAIALRDGWRAGFARHHGRWKLRYFLAGD